MGLNFHIVNSVKGGSGKSFMSLLLASYFQITSDTEKSEDKKAMVCVIDLDINGSSWLKDYNSFLDNNGTYIQDHMYSNRVISIEEAKKLKIQYENETHCIPLFLTNSTKHGELSTCELDLFEHAIFRIVKEIREHDSNKEIHIILDMPPSREKHAERIISHLLMDVNSQLYKEFKKDGSMSPYRIFHYFMCTYMPAHIELNQEYFLEFVKNISFSDSLNEFIKNSCYKFIFVLNNVRGVLNKLDGLAIAKYKEIMFDDIQNDCAIKELPNFDIDFESAVLLSVINGASNNSLVIKSDMMTVIDGILRSIGIIDYQLPQVVTVNN